MNDPDAEDRFIHYPSEIQAMIREFQRTREPALVSPILAGILAKYAPAGDRSTPAERRRKPSGRWASSR